MFQMVTEALGDGVLMYASDYPHYESWFPNSIDKIMDWSSTRRGHARRNCSGTTPTAASSRRSSALHRPHDERP